MCIRDRTNGRRSRCGPGRSVDARTWGSSGNRGGRSWQVERRARSRGETLRPQEAGWAFCFPHA
eukprot:3365270-Prorocentrum_lima.AAC.1